METIIHIVPCSQEIIDNENPIFYVFFGRCEMRLFGCHDNNNCFSFHGNHEKIDKERGTVCSNEDIYDLLKSMPSEIM
jgi:hypothetical protein